ncbi:hypothetical protein [Paenibacillus harenae]|uniref:hypothetical protein n=1 Tax=Paenibacillus harenae TaxID=306543 RepID=UPI00048CD79C|nr:hypothetical protein [Paenibacillus harenae]
MDKKDEKHTYETQPSSLEKISHNNTFNEELLPMQNIEGGGPPKKVDLNTLPKPIRFFGYFLMILAILMLLSAGIVTFFR